MSLSMSALALLRSPKPLIMGILNVTPDSFSDGGEHPSVDRALTAALRMVEQGADIVDVGGESTRPGAERVGEREQIARVVPVIEALRERLPPEVPISIDTTRCAVAAAALNAGAGFINDVSAGRDDQGMLALAAGHRVPIALMHMLGEPKTMQDDPRYRDVVVEVLEFLEARIAAARAAGIPAECIVIDPGIGFGKRKDDNLRLMANLRRFVATGCPVLLGTSRKRFMGAVCGLSQPRDLVPATVATTALGVSDGVRLFRVHDVAENRQAADVAWAIGEQRDQAK